MTNQRVDHRERVGTTKDIKEYKLILIELGLKPTKKELEMLDAQTNRLDANRVFREIRNKHWKEAEK